MSISLSYDSQLSRVRITGAVPGVVDTFTRTVADSWSTSDSGHAWVNSGGSGTDYDIASGVGTHTLTSVNVARASTIALAHADVDYSATVKSDKLAVGAAQLIEFVGRYTNSSNYYALHLAVQTSAQILLQLRKTVAGTPTGMVTVDAGFPHVANTTYGVRLQIVDTTVRAKVWLAANPEPEAWTAETTDSALSAAGSIGMRTLLSTSTSNAPVVFSFDDLYSRGEATVERSTNQINWSTVRGGLLDVAAGTAYTVDDYEFPADVLTYYRIRVNGFSDSASTTPSLSGQTWLKFLHRPFLNTVVTPYGEVNVTRRTRSGTFDVVGRSFPVSVTDLKGSRQFSLQLKTLTTDDHDRLDLVLSGGDPVFLHCPPGSRLPTLYADIGDVSDESPVPEVHFFTLPLTEIAAPGADVVGTTGTYQTIVNNYATYSAVLSAFATYQDILEEVGQPGDIVVP